MFQTFAFASDPALSADRIAALRAQLEKAKLDAFLIPRADEHQGEYVPACAERLKFISGFSGSAGLALIGRKTACLFTDGRYRVQARQEVDTKIFEISELPRPRLAEWIKDNFTKGATIGFDPWLHTATEIERLTAALGAKGISLKPVAGNLVDKVWGKERPAQPANAVTVHPLVYAGRKAEAKLADVQKRLKNDGHDAVVLTLPDSICWLLNIRGSDVAHNPVALAFAIVPSSGKAELFIDRAKISRDVKADLEPVARISETGAFKTRLAALAKSKKKIRLDPDTAAFAIARALGGFKNCQRGADPIIALKAVKNATELTGARSAHIRDGVAMSRFLSWIDREAANGTIDEITAVRELERFRYRTGALREISFDTIAGSGPNGAIVHYRVNEASNRTLQPGELFLIDSGAQYADGTTDITRTIAIGKPSKEMAERFTYVLKGHIAIATARFPKGTRGIELDPFARRALWDAGLDYDHGTGHGVGSYLSVHEGPQSISRAGMAVLQPGMICSNEPGYYKEGHYGIRIENLVVVTEPMKIEGGDRDMLGFETLTLAPIDRRLIIPELLSPAEHSWVDAYHQRVFDSLADELDASTRKWLANATEPLTTSSI